MPNLGQCHALRWQHEHGRDALCPPGIKWNGIHPTKACCMRRELDAFLFVFETANRIVVEEPKFNHATYFFEIEEPLPTSCQVTCLQPP